MASTNPVVLAVDDDEDVLETYRIWLGAEYTVRTATSGEAALETLDDDVDIVLLDRMMSGMSGKQVLEHIRDRDVDCQVLMATAIDPGFDIVDVSFDDYLSKPLDRDQLLDAIEKAKRRADKPPEVQSFLRDLASQEALRQNKDDVILEDERYESLVGKVESAREDLDKLPDDPAELV